MAAKNAAKPRPNKNSNGQDKRPFPTMSHDIHIEPAPPQPAPAPPGAPAPGATNPLTHPNHPAMQSSMGAAGPLPGTAPPGPTAAPQDARQVRENISFKDMNPSEQSQAAQQQGIDPYAPLRMVQQETTGAIGQGASSGPIPNELAGPYVPDGVSSFPDDFAHLSTLMSQGFAPGSSPQEHEFAQNAHALAKAKIDAAFNQAQHGVGNEQAQPYAPAPPQAPGAAPPGVSLAPGIPGMPPPPDQGAPPPGPPLQATPPPGAAPPGAMPPGGPGPGPVGPPPAALIAALIAKHKGAKP